MTKSTITRERARQIFLGNGPEPSASEERELARMALAAMDSESGCKATARICTEMAVNSLVIPNEMTSEQAYEIGYYYGDPVDVFARGANWMRQHIIDSTLAAAPQLPGSDPATVPGKWIPVNERMPEAEGHYLVWANASRIDGYCDHLAIATYQGGEWSNEFNWLVNHWMPLPAAPQEGK